MSALTDLAALPLEPGHGRRAADREDPAVPPSPAR